MDLKTRYILMKAEIMVWYSLEVKKLKEFSKSDFRTILGNLFTYRKLYIFMLASFVIAFMHSVYSVKETKDLIGYKHTMVKGNKFVVFQEMSHIAKQSFYVDTLLDLKSYQSLGFKYFYEGIGITMSVDLNKKINSFYNLAKKCKSDHNIINTGDIIKQYTYYKDGVRADVDAGEMVKLIDNRKNDTCKEIFENVILKQRDEKLLSFINNSKEDKIYIQYGKLHWKGVEKELLKQGYKQIDKKGYIALKIQEK